MSDLIPILLGAAGGILPALAWLWFWLREDSENPEPRRLIALAFCAGMAAVAIVIPIELGVQAFFTSTTVVFILWACIEEITKFALAWASVLHRKENDEPIDPIIYMVTVALGFAAVENFLFLTSPVSGGTLLATILTGDLRFVGATLLHVLASALIGASLSLSFYKPRWIKRWYALFGVILAAALHATFNFLILNTPEDEILRTFSFVWLGLLVLLAFIEFVKRMRPRRV